MTTVIFVAKIALTAYSAVSAVKALSEGNIMGAVMGGFGAYMGMANLGAFNTAVAGDALSLSAATQGEMLAAQTAEFGAEGLSATAEALGGVTTTGGILGDYATALNAASPTVSAAAPELSTGAKEIGAKLDVGGGMDFMESAKGIGSDWIQSIKDGIAKVDFSGNLVSTKDGSLLAKAGEALGGTSGLMKVGGMAMNYLGKEKEIEAQEKAAEEGYARSVAEAKRKRASIGSTPDYVYGFGTRKEGVV